MLKKDSWGSFALSFFASFAFGYTVLDDFFEIARGALFRICEPFRWTSLRVMEWPFDVWTESQIVDGQLDVLFGPYGGRSMKDGDSIQRHSRSAPIRTACAS